MQGIRRRLRTWAAASLVVQSAWLFALMPNDCCAAHRPASSDTACHEVVAPLPDHDMEMSDGAACPMHRAAGQKDVSEPACSMRASCAGPMSALISMLAAQGILPAPSLFPAPVESHRLPELPREQVASLFTTPDSPPPRA